MELTTILAAVLVGYALGILSGILFKVFSAKSQMHLAESLLQQSQRSYDQSLSAAVGNMKDSFTGLSLDALNKSTDEFLKLAKSQLSNERDITVKEVVNQRESINQHIVQLNKQIENMHAMVQDLEKDRNIKFGELTNRLTHSQEQTHHLLQTTNKLTQILSSSQQRGQWGERMAEDILQFAGFLEHVNYIKQSVSVNNRNRPDFTFLLPDGLKLNMDVKFPLENYSKFVSSDNAMERDKFKAQFLKDVKLKIKETATREYINPEENTVDLAIMFIPNEHIFAFILQEDPSLFEEAIKAKIVCCSPLTLFAVLAVVRQASENFSLEKQSNLILKQLSEFNKNWQKFCLGFDKVGKRIVDLQADFEDLSTTRKRALDRPLEKLEELKLESDGSAIES